MNIRQLRILPPLAFARLGSAPTPLDSYAIDDDPNNPLGYRKIRGAETLFVDDETGEVSHSSTPEVVSFREAGDHIRPVAPFLEIWALTDDDKLQPLTPALLKQVGLSVSDVSIRVEVANRKVVRRTRDKSDLVSVDTGWFSTHEKKPLHGTSEHFLAGRHVDFGHVRFIKPNEQFPELRVRFMPAKGLIYGPDKPIWPPPDDPDHPNPVPESRAIYDTSKGKWAGFEVKIPADGRATPSTFENETLPPALFAIVPPAPSWLNNNIAISRGYFDDACDGFVEVKLRLGDNKKLKAKARISSGPPALVPDSLFVRSLADDLDQALHGPQVPKDEPREVTQQRATEIVRRAFETVRFMNVEVMNGNPFKGRTPLSLDTMPAEEAFGTERIETPVMAEQTVDTLAVMALHQQVFAALKGGAAPWFQKLLRQPDEVTDYTPRGRRKMPALMCGADNNYLALTHRQIDTVGRAALPAIFPEPYDADSKESAALSVTPSLTPRNLSAQLHYEARGNPVSSRPVVAIGNCCPGLELDFRAVWRRLLEGIVLREYDNLVVEADDDHQRLVGRRLLRIGKKRVVGQMIGPSPADPDGESVVLATKDNPSGIAPLEWSNGFAKVLSKHKGKKVHCEFTKKAHWYDHAPWTEDPDQTVTESLMVREFFEDDTAVISEVLAEAGELTQGLCSPWQNDYRECSCYYWASARPDYVNVEPSQQGTSQGDNWLQKDRTGQYVPDDYVDSRLILYDDLFEAWEKWLRFQVDGRDAERSGKSSK